MTMYDGKDDTTMAVPGERVRLLQHRQCALCCNLRNSAAHESIDEVTEGV